MASFGVRVEATLRQFALLSSATTAVSLPTARVERSVGGVIRKLASRPLSSGKSRAVSGVTVDQGTYCSYWQLGRGMNGDGV